MGRIHDEVKNGHLRNHPEELDWIKRFQSAFDITWAHRRRAHGSDYSVYFLKPEPATEETFGINREVLLVYSPYDKLEARTLQSIEQFMNDDPARGRVDRLFAILVSNDSDVERWISEYSSTNESRTTVGFVANDLVASGSNAWYVRNRVATQLFARNLFDYRLPLEKDTYFFGRSALLHSFMDSVKNGENRGVFGLRKTGKTSFLYKLMRDLAAQQNVVTLFYDCKSTSIRQRTSSELLRKIAEDLSEVIGVRYPLPSDDRFLSEALAKLIKQIPDHKKVAIIFDEVEYISYFSKTDKHWAEDYLSFWQSIWSAQSETRRLSAILAGVNPQLVETDKIDGVQNPLFGIVPYDYLSGLSVDEIRRMLSVLGRRMGLKFSPDVSEKFKEEYGGHPLLCRLAASFTYKTIRESGVELPVAINYSDMASSRIDRDANLVFYCGHVISELRDFYPDEYQVFELLACGDVADYLEFASLPELQSHLKSYGLVKSVDGTPLVAIEVVGTHVAIEAARRDGRKTIQKLVEEGARQKWLEGRVENIDGAFDELQRVAKAGASPILFGPNNYPESHMFMRSVVVNNKEQFQSFVNTCNRCFVESIDRYGASIGDNGYFWGVLKAAYPSLHKSLNRIKVYRHNEFHLELNDNVDAVYRAYITQDLEGRSPARVEELWFTLQQSILDSLWNSVQVELSRYGR
ncbi:AAA family ATPase [Sphingobium naphthae]|uniref:ORC1/DEAH AAA+ ATPase domain-containing protein n=1 Tax=Sphingobium naphthae TaxID=1886786 RepID=A0ABU4A1W7_9SPHN|nr:AAA family ATPase [Sphingobium naphthae]MDV5825724.1 hypothetical protein [Sphingobium naphthae]